MSNRARLGLVALAAVVAVAAFVLAGSADEEKEKGSAPAPAGTTADNGGREPTATARSAPEPPAEVRLRGHRPVGGVQEIEVESGEQVRLVVLSDAPDDIHVHGYDLEREVAPRRPATFRFAADLEGIFEIESHEAEHEGADPLIAKLVVKPG